MFNAVVVAFAIGLAPATVKHLRETARLDKEIRQMKKEMRLLRR